MSESKWDAGDGTIRIAIYLGEAELTEILESIDQIRKHFNNLAMDTEVYWG